ncbi:MAG: GTPase HflX [Candidatus Bathyarchaeia archaeon]
MERLKRAPRRRVSKRMRAVVAECRIMGKPSKIEEVVSMASSLGYEVVGIVSQRRRAPHASFCIGRGKMEELKELVEGRMAESVIFANGLSGSQAFKISRELGGDIKVIDRNMLILELFKERAMTKEAQLQIQLARLRYTFSWGREYLRLEGILGEQVGWSGPGDYPFKEYERAARRRISRLERALEAIERRKDALRARRRELGFPTAVLTGYTQSGKTTFFNLVARESKSVGIGPFTTLSTFARRVEYRGEGGRSEFMLVDSIGFIEDMHPIILDAFHSTLSEISNADLVLLFLDASEDPQTLSRKASYSDEILKRLGIKSPTIVCANKIDLLSERGLKKALGLIRELLPGREIIPLSAKLGENVDLLLARASSLLSAAKEMVVDRD